MLRTPPDRQSRSSYHSTNVTGTSARTEAHLATILTLGWPNHNLMTAYLLPAIKIRVIINVEKA